MDSIASTVIAKLVTMGGGYVLASVLLYLFIDQRRTNAKLSDSLLQLTRQQTEAITSSSEVLRRVEDLFRELIRRS